MNYKFFKFFLILLSFNCVYLIKKCFKTCAKATPINERTPKKIHHHNQHSLTSADKIQSGALETTTDKIIIIITDFIWSVINKFGVILPDNRYGLRSKELIENILIENKSQISKIVLYDPKKPNFYQVVKEVANYEKRKFEYILLTPDDYKSKVVIPNNFINDSYDDYLSKASERNQIRISHIMIDKVNYESDGDAYNAIQEIESKLLNGASFIDLASEYSDDFVSRDNGGDLEYFSPDFFDEKFGEAIKDLKLNDVSKIVELDSSFHIIKVTEYQEAEILSFDEMKDSITSNLIDSESLALMKDDYDLAYDLIDSNSSMTSISNSLSAEITETDFVTLNNFKADIDDRRVQEYIFAPEKKNN